MAFGKNKQTIENSMDKIITLMESGKMNWNKPWSGGTMPQNFVSKKPYQGWNVFVTMFSGFTSPYYLTFNQVSKLGGKVLTGSKGVPIMFWSKMSYKDKQDPEKMKQYLMVKTFTVFNAEQIEGIDFTSAPLNTLGTCEELETAINSMALPVTIEHSSMFKACYSPLFDKVKMPLKGQFKSEAEYYSTLIHETIHATGHKARLNRPSLVDSAGKHSETYAYDELVAELGAAFMTAMFGIANEQSEKNSAAYLQGWIKAFKNDKEMLYNASRDAQKAIEYIIGKALPVESTEGVEMSEAA